ncbi:MAG: gliding motility-associated C-terminal domain-containing protein, partial [Saprospiraceae bacterium]|nr:gliding motility-associated C-terminal domain-containing protein [Saprospiraceae bacterium]
PASVTLAPGESQIFSATYTITQDDVDAGSVFNTATATGLDPDNNPVSDADDATVNALQYPLMGVSKWVNDGPHNNFDGTFTLTYGIRVENMGNVTLNDIQITEDLSAAFGTAEQYQVIQIASSALTVNNLFDGEADLLLLSGSDQLAVGEDASLELTIVVKPGINLGPYMNTVVGVGVTPSFVPVSDLSQNGLLSDPDGDHDPINNDVPTPLSFACLPTLNNLPPDLTLSCEEVNQLMDEVTATSPGCCLPLELTKDVERIDGICADQYTLIITWTATDACGQSISAQQHVTLVDQTAPVFSLVPVSVTVECDNLPLVPEVGTHVIASDLCDSSVKYMTGETVIPGHCKNAFQIVRTWTAIDNCGNSSTAQHSVTVIDTQAPAFENLPSDLTLDCSEAVPAAMGVEVKDNCDAQVSFTLTENQADPGDCTTSTITRVWTATDNCGNATSAIQTVTVKDDQPPFLTGVPADMTVDCHQVPQQAQVVATDDCSDPVALAFHETRQDGSCPGQYSLTRTWVATDACGNETSAQQIVTVVDLSAPQLTGVPADITIGCDIELPVAAQVIALDLCDPAVIVQFTESLNGNGSCANGVVVRTWSATDHCGHSVTAVQHITIQDVEGPVLTGVPGDITVACHEVPQPAWVTAFDNCSEPVEISFTENQVAGNCPGNYQLVRTWIASDACGNLTSSQQKITVKDQQAPVITPIHPLLTGTPSGSVLTVNSCQVEALAIKDVQVYDNCDPDPLVTITETIKDGDCLTDGFLMEQTVTWTVTDACGNASSYHIVIRVGDHTPPVLQGLPASGSFSCDAVPAPAQVTAEDNCGAPVTITFEEKRLNGGCDGEYMLIRTWTATDACGNTASGLQTLKIHDNSGPVITPLHPMIAGQPSGTVFTINCDQVGVMDESDVAAIDNCQADPLVVFSETVKFGQCATDGYLYELTCTWTATDACGNANAYYIIVRVTDSTPPLLVGVPADETVDCDVVLSPALVLAEDNCGDPVTMNLDFEQKDGACLGEYQIIRTWTATDGCGNTATGQQTISVLDTKAPIITPSHPMIAGQPSGTVFTITCDQVGVMNENDVSVTDKCHVAPSVVFSETVKFGQCVTDGYLYEMTCTWTATDDCGNASEYFIVVRVTDQQAPVLSDVPSDVTVDMTAGDTLPEVSVPAVTDDCDQDPEVVLEETVILQPCGYLLVRTWTATDDCGNSLQGTQHITVKEACPCDLPVLRQWEVRHPDCGAWNGAIAIDMENDTTDYVFEWHPAVGQANANGNERTNLPPGSYTVKVFANGQEDCYLLLDTALVVQGSCVDTVYVEIPQDTPYEVCLDQVLDLVGPIGSATTCGFQVSAIESVVTESAGDCVLIDPVNGFTGTTTICVIHCDQASPSTCDTTYIFVTIPQAAPPCPILFSDSELEIQSTSCDQQAPVCLAVDRSLFQGYVWQMDGKAMSGIPAPCHVDTMVSYQAEEMPDMGLDGPYMLESWIMDGITYQGEFLNVTDLTALLTQWDPAGQWQWDSLNGTLTGGRPGGTYGHMEITQLSTGATSSLFPVKRIRKSGVVFNLNEGVHYLQISHPGTACKEEMWITVLCEDEEDLLAVSDSATTRKNKSVKIRVLSNDIFNPLSLAEVVILDLPAHGQVGVLHDLDVLYTPEQDFCGQDSFTYQLCTDAGCDTATVYVDVQCSGFVVHTGFSPNGDGINDRFTITGIEDFPGNELTVFNRWGNQVFHQKGYKNNWDGTWNGSTLPDGTYFYFLDDGDGHTHTGYVQIHR